MPLIKPQTTYLKDYQPPSFLVTSIELEVDIEDKWTVVTSKVKGHRNPKSIVGNEPLIFNGEGQTLLDIKCNGRVLKADEYKLTDENLIITDIVDEFCLVIISKNYPQNNKSLEGLYLSEGMYCTQCEAEGFRKITFFPDRPDVMSLYRTRIIACKTAFPVLLSNGHLIDSGDLQYGRHYAVWEDPFPKPSYLFALVAGDLACVEDRFTTISGKTISLKIFVEHGEEQRCQHAMMSLKNAMAWDERKFGLEYDLNVFMVVAVSHFNMGAMENKGLNIFNSRYILADTETATDADFQRIEAIIAHEYFHNWTGNRVTCRDWFQLSLKEGLTVFRDQEFTADMHSRGVQRINDVRLLRSLQFPEDAGPTSHPVRPESYVEINNFYTVTIYEKGAELVRLIHNYIGSENFKNGIKLYFQRHDGQSATCEDFLSAMQDASGKNLSSMISWYTQSGTPELEVSMVFDPQNNELELNIKQFNPPTSDAKKKKPLPILLQLGLLDYDGKEYLLKQNNSNEESEYSSLLKMEVREQSYIFTDINNAPVPSLLRDFSSPVKLKITLGYKELFVLMTQEKDPFVCWDAGQQYAIRIILEIVDAQKNEQHFTINTDYIKAIEAILLNDTLEPALRAELLKLPSENDLAQAMAVIDVDNIHFARCYIQRHIGQEIREKFQEIYDKMLDGLSPVDLSTEAMGRRALASVCLLYLTAKENVESLKLALNQVISAKSMTLTVAALTALNDIQCKERDEALDNFFFRWNKQPLELDKWFSLQASSALESSFQTVKDLTSAKEFDILNPNRVRSLLGSFVNNNPVNFHRLDGEGYEFLADKVIQLNCINPQVGARLVIPLTRWHSHIESRKKNMKYQLERIINTDKLSPDVLEIVQKGLTEG